MQNNLVQKLSVEKKTCGNNFDEISIISDINFSTIWNNVRGWRIFRYYQDKLKNLAIWLILIVKNKTWIVCSQPVVTTNPQMGPQA